MMETKYIVAALIGVAIFMFFMYKFVLVVDNDTLFLMFSALFGGAGISLIIYTMKKEYGDE